MHYCFGTTGALQLTETTNTMWVPWAILDMPVSDGRMTKKATAVLAAKFGIQLTRRFVLCLGLTSSAALGAELAPEESVRVADSHVPLRF